MDVLKKIAAHQQWLLFIIIIALVSFSIFVILMTGHRMRINRLKEATGEKKMRKKRKKFTLKFIDYDKIDLNLHQAGYPFKKFGLDAHSYHFYKLTFAILSAISVKNFGLKQILYGIVGYFILDVYIRMMKRRRKDAIKEMVDSFLTITIDGLQMGYTPQEIMSTAIKKLPADSPLNEEVRQLNLQLLKGSLIPSLNAFRKRIDLEEIDTYCFSLMQYEIGGRAIKMMQMQLDLINTLKINKKKRETMTRSNFSSIATALLVVAIAIIIILPLLAYIKDMPVFSGTGV